MKHEYIFNENITKGNFLVTFVNKLVFEIDYDAEKVNYEIQNGIGNGDGKKHAVKLRFYEWGNKTGDAIPYCYFTIKTRAGKRKRISVSIY